MLSDIVSLQPGNICSQERSCITVTCTSPFTAKPPLSNKLVNYPSVSLSFLFSHLKKCLRDLNPQPTPPFSFFRIFTSPSLTHDRKCFRDYLRYDHASTNPATKRLLVVLSAHDIPAVFNWSLCRRLFV